MQELGYGGRLYRRVKLRNLNPIHQYYGSLPIKMMGEVGERG